MLKIRLSATVTMTNKKEGYGMNLKVIDFNDLQMKPLLYGLINQTILPLNDLTMNINKGDMLDISFNDKLFKDYKLLVTNVSLTNLEKVSSEDITRNGFVYKPSFLDYMRRSRNVGLEDSVVKLDFELTRSE